MPTIVDKKVHDKANCSRLHELHVWSWSREFYGEYICKVCHMKFPAENYLRIHTGSKQVKRISEIKIGKNLINLVKSRSSPFFSFFSSNFFFFDSKHLLPLSLFQASFIYNYFSFFGDCFQSHSFLFSGAACGTIQLLQHLRQNIQWKTLPDNAY